MKDVVAAALGSVLMSFSLVSPQVAAARPVALAAGDLDADPSCPSCADLVVADQGASAVVLRFGNGDGSFGAPLSLPLPRRPEWVATGDCDSDGDDDVFAVHRGAVSLSVFVNQQAQGSPRVFLAAPGSPADVDRRATFVLARDDRGDDLDLDGDGSLDLVVLGRRAVTTLHGNGACGFAALQSDLVANKPVAVAAADFDGGTGPDLAIADRSGSPTFPQGAAVTVLLNDGSGAFPSACVAPGCRQYDVPRKPTSIVAANLDAAAGIDLLFTSLRGAGGARFNPGYDGFGVLFGSGTGIFGATVLLGSQGRAPLQVVTGDFAGDGAPDAVVVNRGSATIAGFEGPSGTFLASADVGEGPVALAAGQMDVLANTDLDVVVARRRSRDLALCLGAGDGSFSCSALP